MYMYVERASTANFNINLFHMVRLPTVDCEEMEYLLKT